MEKRITRIQPSIPLMGKLDRVAAYARVSSGKDAMLHSMSAQVSYYSDLIQRNPEWLYAGVYADEAYTGTLEFYHIVQGIVERLLRLLIVDSCTIDCRKVPYDPTTAAYMDLASMLYMLEVSERFSKKRSVSSGVRLERKKISRPLTTLDDIPDLFFMYYPQYEADEISVSEFARRCKLSRPSIYKYTRIVREVNERKH